MQSKCYPLHCMQQQPGCFVAARRIVRTRTPHACQLGAYCKLDVQMPVDAHASMQRIMFSTYTQAIHAHIAIRAINAGHNLTQQHHLHGTLVQRCQRCHATLVVHMLQDLMHAIACPSRGRRPRTLPHDTCLIKSKPNAACGPHAATMAATSQKAAKQAHADDRQRQL